MTAAALSSLLSFSWRRRVPVILQAEATECGLACVAMIAAYHGRRQDLRTIRSVAGSGTRGLSASGLVAVAEGVGLQVRPVRLEMDELGGLATPCILHWGIDHFVVLVSSSRARLNIIDPAVGRRRVSFNEVSRKFTGIAFELLPAANFRKLRERRSFSLRQMFRGVRGLGAGLAGILVVTTGIELVAILAPLLTQLVTDHVIPFADYDLLTVLGFGFVFIVVVQAALSALKSWMVACLSSSLGLAWGANVFGHLLRLPASYFQQRSLGDITSRFGALGVIQGSMTTSLIEAALDLLVALSTLVLLFAYSGTLGMLTAASFCIYALLRVVMFAQFQEAQHEQIVADANRDTLVMELLRGVQSVRLLNGTTRMSARFANLAADAINKSFVTHRLSLVFGSASTLVFGVQRVAMIWMGAHAVLGGTMTVGMLMASTAYGMQFTSRGGGFIDYMAELWMIRLHADRLSDIVLCLPEQDTDAKCMLPEGGCAISIKGLHFRYSASEPYVLREFDLEVAPGESVAIVGASGCGKSTLAKLILGLLEPSVGEIRVGGVPLAKVGKYQFRDIAGSVMQDDQLFTGSIADNISFFAENHDQGQVEAAAIKANIHHEVMAMPMGYRTLVGDMGASLSGGQKQRLLLARALYRGPRVLVLDEATSHLDAANETCVNDVIRGANTTRIVMAHRQETIAAADRVVLIEEGRARMVRPAEHAV